MGERIFEQRWFHGQIETLIRNQVEEETGRDVVEVDLFVEEDDNKIGAIVKSRQQ